MFYFLLQEYIDKRRNARANPIEVGDIVLMKEMVKRNKLTPEFGSADFTVVDRNGSDVLVQSQAGQTYRRNVTHLKKVPTANPDLSAIIMDKLPDLDTEDVDNRRPKRNISKPKRYEA